MSVKKLEKSVQSQLRSDFTTHSITSCIMELVENAIDAQSTSIAIRMNLSEFQIQVFDDGVGMTEKQLNVVGRRHCTSKWNSGSRSKYFGYRGESIANLRKSCDRLLIITRASKSEDTFCKVFEKDGSSLVVKANHQRVSKGTTVIMNNVLGSTPIRQACVIPSKEWQNVKEYIRATALMHPMISFNVEDNSRCIEILRISRVKTTQEQFKKLYLDIAESISMKKLLFEKDGIQMKAIASSQMCLHKKLQFVFVNKRFISNSNIQKYFKTLLLKCFRDTKMKEAMEVKSRWQPIFVLNITCPEDTCSIFYESNRRFVEFRNRIFVSHCLFKLSNQFRQMMGVDKISSPHVISSNENQAKSKATFVAKELFEKLKDANAIFGIPTTREVTGRSRYRQHLNEKPELKNTEQLKRERFIKRSPPILSVATCSAAPTMNFSGNNIRSDEENENISSASRLASLVTENEEERSNREIANSTASKNDEENDNFQTICHDSETVFDDLHNHTYPGEIDARNTSVPESLPFVKYNNAEINSRNDVTPALREEESAIYAHSNFTGIQRSRKKNNIILREARLKFDGFFDFKFPVQPSNNVFINYLERKFSNTFNIDTSKGCKDFSILENSISKKFPIQDPDENEDPHETSRKSNVGVDFTRTGSPESNHFDANHSRLPYCCCSCHDFDTQNNTRGQDLSFNSGFRDGKNSGRRLGSNISNFELTASNIVSLKQISIEERTKSSCADCPEVETFSTRSENELAVSPFLVSPYFHGSQDFLEEDETARKNNSSYASNTILDESLTPRCVNEVKCFTSKETNFKTVTPLDKTQSHRVVIDDLTMKSLRKKMKYKMNCKMLCDTGAVDIPNGMLEANNLRNRRVDITKETEGDLRTIVRTFKNRHSINDEGYSYLRVFRKFQKNRQSTSHILAAPEELNCSIPFVKTDLRNLKFLAQIDRKYLLTKMRRSETNEEIIVIFDQHAVDERIRVERLFLNYTDEYGVWNSISVNPPIYPDVHSSDISLIREFTTSFEKKGLYFEFHAFIAQSGERYHIAVVKVPTCLHGKAIKESTSSDFGLKLKALVEALMKELIELINSGSPIQNVVPDTLRKELNYEACRGAVKFGDELSDKVCLSLLKKVSNCEQPFQCAHGRPLIIPLINLTKIQFQRSVNLKENKLYHLYQK